jgi:hypothetical protein
VATPAETAQPPTTTPAPITRAPTYFGPEPLTDAAFGQILRRGHYGLATDASPSLRLATAFSELALAI